MGNESAYPLSLHAGRLIGVHDGLANTILTISRYKACLRLLMRNYACFEA